MLHSFEEIRTKNLKRWNEEQKILWTKLADDKIVEKDDINMFCIFADFFHKYCRNHQQPPNYEETKNFIENYKKER